MTLDAPQALLEQHAATMKGLSPEVLLAVARELLAARIRAESERAKQFVTRRESLEAVVQAEADARAKGGKPVLDFLLDIDLEIPLGAA